MEIEVHGQLEEFYKNIDDFMRRKRRPWLKETITFEELTNELGVKDDYSQFTNNREISLYGAENAIITYNLLNKDNRVKKVKLALEVDEDNMIRHIIGLE